MGQAANDLVEGFACSECGIYFEASHGYPVLCESCHKYDQKQSKGKRSGIPCTQEDQLG